QDYRQLPTLPKEQKTYILGGISMTRSLYTRFRPFFLLALAVALPFALATRSISPRVSAAGNIGPQKHKNKESKKGKKSNKNSNAPSQPGTPALWEDRGEISSLNLFWGIGSEEEMPKPPFQFDKEDVTGTNPKIKVIDANGVKWNFKFDEEVHAEVASSRIVWACGY